MHLLEDFIDLKYCIDLAYTLRFLSSSLSHNVREAAEGSQGKLTGDVIDTEGDRAVIEHDLRH